MTKFLELIAPLLDKLSWSKVGMLAVITALALGSGLAWENREIIIQKPAPTFVPAPALKRVSPESARMISQFMKKHSEVALFTVLSFDLSLNVRKPIFRDFNSNVVKAYIDQDASQGIDGSLPIFIRDNVKSNNQMISLIQGEYSCSPVGDGGIVKVYPGLKDVIKVSCRVPIPPAWSGGAKGYIAIHIDREIDQTQMEILKLDLMTLAMYIYNTDVEGEKAVKVMP